MAEGEILARGVTTSGELTLESLLRDRRIVGVLVVVCGGGPLMPPLSNTGGVECLSCCPWTQLVEVDWLGLRRGEGVMVIGVSGFSRLG